MIVQEYRDITGMWQDLMNRALWAPHELVDFKIKGRTIAISDALFCCESTAFDLDLATIGCTASRWKVFLRDHVDRVALKEWLQKCLHQPEGTESFFLFKSRSGRWPCPISLGYRRSPQPRLCLISRVAILPMPGTLELALSSVVGKELGDPRFSWFVSSLQWEDMRQLSYLINRDLLDSFINNDTFLGRQVGVNYRGALGHHISERRRRTVQNALAVKQLPPLRTNVLLF